MRYQELRTCSAVLNHGNDLPALDLRSRVSGKSGVESASMLILGEQVQFSLRVEVSCCYGLGTFGAL